MHELENGNVGAVQQFSRHAEPATVAIHDDRRTDEGGRIAELVAAALEGEGA